MPNGPAIRLGVTDDGTMDALITKIGEGGDASAKRLAASYQRAFGDAEAAAAKASRAAAAVQAASAGFSDKGVDQNAQVKAYAAYMADQARAAEALRNVIDPLRVAQAAYDRELEVANALLRSGNITEAEHAASIARSNGVLQQARSRLDEASEGQRGLGASGMIAEHVVRSFSDSIAAGQSPLRAFTMESGRVVEGLTLWAAQSGKTEGAVGKLAGFMSGPWGLAATLAITLGSSLVSEWLAGGDAAEAQTGKVRTLADAIDDLNKASGAELVTERQRIAQGAAEVIRLGQVEIATRKATLAKLDNARADAAAAAASNVPGTPSYVGAGAREVGTQGYVKGLTDTYNEQTAAIGRAEGALRSAAAFMARDDIANHTNANKAATDGYKGAVDRLTTAYRDHRITLADYTKDVANETAKRDAAIEAARKHGQAHDSDAASARADAAAQRDLAKAEEERINTVQALLDKARPGESAFGAYQNDMAAIHAQLAAGAITPDEASDAGREAGAIFAKAVAAAAQAQFEADKGKLSPAVQAMLGSGDSWVSSEQVKAFEAQTNAAISLAINGIPKTKEQIALMDDLKSAGDHFVDDVLNPSTWSSWGNAGKTILNDLMQEFEKLAIINPLKNALFGEKNATFGGGGGGGLFSSLFGGLFGGGGGGGLNNAFANPEAYASGTDYAKGGLAWVAENGPELIRLPKGASVTPAPQTRKLMQAANEPARIVVAVEANDDVFTARVAGIAGTQIQAAAPNIANGGAVLGRASDNRRRNRTMA